MENYHLERQAKDCYKDTENIIDQLITEVEAKESEIETLKEQLEKAIEHGEELQRELADANLEISTLHETISSF